MVPASSSHPPRLSPRKTRRRQDDFDQYTEDEETVTSDIEEAPPGLAVAVSMGQTWETPHRYDRNGGFDWTNIYYVSEN